MKKGKSTTIKIVKKTTTKSTIKSSKEANKPLCEEWETGDLEIDLRLCLEFGDRNKFIELLVQERPDLIDEISWFMRDKGFMVKMFNDFYKNLDPDIPEAYWDEETTRLDMEANSFIRAAMELVEVEEEY